MTCGRPYRHRSEAGRALAAVLDMYRGRSDVVVLGLPRGGVPVAAEVATHLGVNFDVLLVRKLGVPGHAELAMGAIAEGGVQVVNDDVVDALGVTQAVLAEVARREGAELEHRRRLYRGDRPPPALGFRTVIVVDDGLATGATMRVAVAAVRREGPARVVVGVPVGAASTCRDLAGVADEVVCVCLPEPFRAVGLWYEEFDPPSDEEIRRLLGGVPTDATMTGAADVGGDDNDP